MKKIIALIAVLVAGMAAAAGIALSDSDAPTLCDGGQVTYRSGGQTVVGDCWLDKSASLQVAGPDGVVRQIARTDVVTATTPTTPTDTGTTPTTPDDPVPGPRPFSDDSPFNTPLGSAPSNASAVSLMPGGLPSSISTDRDESINWDHPVYYSKATDPLATLSLGNDSFRWTVRVPVPSYAVPAGGGDHHMAVIWDGWEYNLWNATRSGSPGNYTYRAQIGGRLPANGQGIKTPQLVQQYGNQIDGGVEAKFSSRAGLITASDMKSGVIDHALFAVVSKASGKWTYPAYNSAGQGTNPQMGTRLKLNMTAAQIDATNAPSYEKIVAKAAAKYGIYIGDKGGPGFAFQFESSTPYNAAGVTNPWKSYFDSVGIRDSGTYGYVMNFRTSAIWSNLVYTSQPTP